jgi:predicted transcriptional regulator
MPSNRARAVKSEKDLSSCTQRTSSTVSASILLEYRADPRRAITDTGVICLVCGRSFRHLTNTHLQSHNLTSDQYKQLFGYNLRRALMASSVRNAHSQNATKAGLAGRIRRWPILEGTELRKMGGRRTHTLEEAINRRERGRRDSRGRFASAQAV